MAVIVRLEEKLQERKAKQAAHSDGRKDSEDAAHASAKRRGPRTIFFSRPELSALLALYSTRVARGEWRDYAIDHCLGFALFSVFRHSHESPVFAVAKIVDGQRHSVAYEVFCGRKTVCRSRQLSEAIAAIDPPDAN